MGMSFCRVRNLSALGLCLSLVFMASCSNWGSSKDTGAGGTDTTASNASTFARPLKGIWTSACLPGDSVFHTQKYEVNITEDGHMTVASYSFRSNRCMGTVADLRYRAGRVLRLSHVKNDLYDVEVVMNPPHMNLDFMSGTLRIRLQEDAMQVAPFILLQQYQNSVLTREWRGGPGPMLTFTLSDPS